MTKITTTFLMYDDVFLTCVFSAILLAYFVQLVASVYEFIQKQSNLNMLLNCSELRNKQIKHFQIAHWGVRSLRKLQCTHLLHLTSRSDRLQICLPVLYCRLEKPKYTNQQHMMKRSFYTHILLSFFMSAKILEGIWVMWFSSNRLKQRICKRNGYQKHNVFKMSETKHSYIQKMRISLSRRSRHSPPPPPKSSENKVLIMNLIKRSVTGSLVQNCQLCNIAYAHTLVSFVLRKPYCCEECSIYSHLSLSIALWYCPHRTTEWSIRLLANPTITGIPTFEIQSSEFISGFEYMV